MKERIERLSQALTQAGLDGLVLNPGPSLTYLTGLHFHLMERSVVGLFLADEQVILILPALEQAKLAGLDFTPLTAAYSDDPGTWKTVFKQALAGLSDKKMIFAVESTRLRFLELDFLQSALPKAHFVDAAEVLANLRISKDPSELKRMRQAALIAQKALLACLKTVRPGQSEKEIASELLVQLFKAGSEPELPFAPIVSTGPNTANPHAVPTDRTLQKGEMLLIDWGAAYEDYCSDITRTFYCGEPSAEMQQVADLVLQANTAARLGGKSGMPAGEIDRLARDVITSGVYGDNFIHRTGHGLGMEAHEAPYMFADNPLILRDGMVFTVEPGIYLPDRFGVRIEDDVYVAGDHLVSLTDLPRQVVALEKFWE